MVLMVMVLRRSLIVVPVRGLGLTMMLAALIPTVAHAQVDTVRNHLDSKQRGVDQLSNPAYLAAFAPLLADYAQTQNSNGPVVVDPFRLAWAPSRGEQRTVTYYNRYGVKLSAELFSPRTPARPLPAVLLMTGGGSAEKAYRGIAQGLAEAGYLVLGVEAQGDGANPATPPDPDPATPENEACAPGAWQEPQEMNIRETGPCPGQPATPASESPVAGTPVAGSPADPAILGLLADQYANGTDYDGLAEYYELVKARKTFAALDAVAFMLSDDNPWRSRVKASRIGIVGHSLGAHAALLAGNGDKRFDAVVTYDGYGRLADTAPARVPTMFQHADGEEFGPYHTLPDPEALPGNRDAKRFVQAGVDTMVVTLGGATHQEWNYVPAQLANPFCSPFCTASRDGERVGLFYTRAWLDLHLKGRKAAGRRLLAQHFDATADRSSIGAGTYRPETRANVPYRIAGKSVRRALSPLFRSWAAFGGNDCNDLRAACP